MKRRPSSITAALAQAARWYDAAALAVVPMVLVGVFALPHERRVGLAMSYADPSVLSLYTATFTHFSAGHLASNLVGYLLVAPTAYLLCALADYRRTFWGVFAVFVFAFPIAISAVNASLFRDTAHTALGFSGVLAAFFGFLPVAMLWYLRRRFTGDLELRHAAVLYFTGIGTIAVIGAPAGRPTTLVLAVVGVGIALVGRRLVTDLSRLSLSAFEDALTPAGYVELAVLALVLFLGFPFAAFPTISVSGGAFTNLYVHLVGYSMGYLVPYVTFVFAEPDEGAPVESHGWDG